MGFVNGSSRSPGPRRSLLVRLALIFLAQLYCTAVAMAGGEDKPKVVGVLYVVHGAARTQDFSHFFDAAIQMGSYDASSPLYQTIWQSENWSSVVPLTDVERAAPLLGFFRKANFEFGRLGNLQPATRITEAQTASLQRELESRGRASNTRFVVDWVAWIAGSDDLAHLPYPRFIYESWYRDPFSSGDWAVWKPGQVSALALEVMERI